MFRSNVPYNDADVEMFLPRDFHSKDALTDFARVPYMPSLLLTAANRVFANFLQEQVDVATHAGKSWPLVSYAWRQLVRINATAVYKHEMCRYREQFLAAFSTMVSHILSSSGEYRKVTICGRCVRRFVRAVAAVPTSSRVGTFTTQLSNFVCDPHSLEAFAIFAQHLRNKGLIRAESASFASLLTKSTMLIDVPGVAPTEVHVDDWQLLHWLWVHQVFATISTARVTSDSAPQHYYFIYTLVLVPFVQLHCIICAGHAIQLNLPEMFKRNFAQLALDARRTATVWHNFGYYLHTAVNESLKYVTRRDVPQRLVSQQEFYDSMLPFLLHEPLRRFHCVKRDATTNQCSFESKTHMLPAYASHVPATHVDSFFNDNSADTVCLAEDILAYKTLRNWIRLEQ